MSLYAANVVAPTHRVPICLGDLHDGRERRTAFVPLGILVEDVAQRARKNALDLLHLSAPSTSNVHAPNPIQYTHLVPRIHHILERRDDRQPRTDGRLVVKHPPSVRPIGDRPDDTLVQLKAARKRLLVRRHDVDARVQETRVRLCDRLGRGVVHEDDFARFALCEAGQGVEQAVEARCLRTGIIECVGPLLGNEAASAVREEAHLAGVGDGSDADGVRIV